MKRRFLKKLIGGAGFATALFVFQACYGAPQDFEPDTHIHGKVVSAADGLPIEGIKVSVKDFQLQAFTNSAGEFSIYASFVEGEQFGLLFEDVDASEHGSFVDYDTLITVKNDNIFVPVSLISE